MAHAWVERGDSVGWSVVPLEGGSYEFSGSGLTELGGPSSDGAAQQSPVLIRRSNGGTDVEWILLSTDLTRVSVNGQPLVLGVRVLRDRDEITVRRADGPGPLRCFFSTQRLAHVQLLPAGDGPVRCARCKNVIVPQTTAVRCPKCELWHHQMEDGRNCWTYTPGCASCGHPTQLDGTYQWTPEAL